MLTFKDKNPNYLQDERYINGYESDGEKIIVYFNDGYKFEIDEYDEKIIDDLNNQMVKQYEEASLHRNSYLTDVLVNRNTIIGTNGILAMLIGAASYLPSWILPLIISAPPLLAITINSYKDMRNNMKLIDALDKYIYWSKYQLLIKGYNRLLFNEEKDTEGYEPYYITPNDLESYSLQELQELVEGIKEEYKRTKKA